MAPALLASQAFLQAQSSQPSPPIPVSPVFPAMLPLTLLSLALLTGLQAAPAEDSGYEIAALPVADRVAEEIEEAAEEELGARDVDLMETGDEAVADRIMEDINGINEKFDIALNRIGDEINKDEAEQDEKTLQ